jgi:integrase
LGRSAPTSEIVPASVEQPQAAISLDGAIQEYLDEVRRFRSPKTIAACENMLSRFSAGLPGMLIKDITRRNLLDHMSTLKGEGLGDRTICNHISRINTLLKANGVINLLGADDKPKFDEKDVTAYNSDELAVLFAAATAEERLLFEFFLGTGFREQEVMYCTWANIDLKSKVASVWSKPEMGFRVKDKEERSVPVPDSLIDALANRKKHSTSMLIFPGKDGKLDGISYGHCRNSPCGQV